MFLILALVSLFYTPIIHSIFHVETHAFLHNFKGLLIVSPDGYELCCLCKKACIVLFIFTLILLIIPLVSLPGTGRKSYFAFQFVCITPKGRSPPLL